MRLTVWWLCCALVACGGNDVDDDDDDDDGGGLGIEADADTDTDTDTDSDTDADTDADTDSDTDVDEGDPEAGYDVFLATCAASGCHGSDGNDGPAPNLQGAVSTHSDAVLTEIILDGTGTMPGQDLEPQELADVIAFLRDAFP